MFKLNAFDIEEIVDDKASAEDAVKFINENLKEVKKKDLSEKALLRISEFTQSRYVYKISKDGQTVGEITFGKNETKPVIGIGIEEEFRNRGIGYNILQELIKRRSADEGIEYFVYTVRSDNLASIRLVEKLGGVKAKTFKLFEHNDLAIFTYHIPPINK